MWQLMHPATLWLLALPTALALYFFCKRRTERSLMPMPDPGGVLAAQSRKTKRIFRTIFGLTLLGFCALVVVIARPIRVTGGVGKTAEGIDIMLVLDVSESMDATDFEPNRIEVAKNVMSDFIHKRAEDRLGLILFGGEAVTKSPLTRDYDFLLSQVADVRLRELKQGTAIGMAIANAVSKLKHSRSKSKVIVLLTDGDSNVGTINPITAAYLAREEKIKIYSIGIGRQNRVVVPIYAYDSMGRKTQLIAQVPSYLNPELLMTLSKITHGKAFMAKDSEILTAVLSEIDKLERTKYKIKPISRKEEVFFPVACSATCLLFLLFVSRETRFQRIRPQRKTSRVAT